MRFLPTILILLTAPLFSQQTPPAAQTPAATPSDGPVKFSSTSQLVVERVTLTDKSGKPVEGLTSKDFVVTENGVPQTIRFTEFQKLQEVTPPAPQQELARRDTPPAPPVAVGNA